MKVDEGLLSRFWAKVKKGAGCWEWTASRVGNGYGRISQSRSREAILAHRLSYEIHFGSIPDGMSVLHKCDNPGCVRPDHLFLGTKADNNRDRAQKGRNNSVKGESHGQSKLTREKVRRMRQLYESGITVTSLAKEFGISQPEASKIVHREAWKHID